MPFPPVPTYTKNQIKRAGKLLVNPGNSTDAELAEALDIVGKWRSCHAYPINTFRATLTVKTSKGYGKHIIAQRLKRLPTIVDKLKRYPNMQLTTMQDIGGIRVVLNNVTGVYKLVGKYNNTIRFEHELVDFHDYIKEPRSEDGYRSIHLIYKYKNNRGDAKQYNGLKIELQIRTKLQHTWATAVETMGNILGQALKSRQGDQEWQDFFAITSSAFAYKEGTKRVPRYAHLNRQQTFGEVAKATGNLNVLELMAGYSTALEDIGTKTDRKKWAYHLITLDSEKRTFSIRSYGREQLKEASAEYAAQEALAKDRPEMDSVLVSAGPIENLRAAYPNYFLDVSDFIVNVRAVIEEYENTK